MKISELQLGEGAFMLGTLALIKTPNGILIGGKQEGIKLASATQFTGNMDLSIEKVDINLAIDRLSSAIKDPIEQWDMLMMINFVREKYVTKDKVDI